MPSVRRDSTTEVEQHVNNLLDSAIHVKGKAKAKVKHLLDSAETEEDEEEDIFSDAAFDPAKVLDNTSPKAKKSTRETVSDGAKAVSYLVSHPKRVMRGKATRVAAEKLGNARHTILTLDRDRELLDAHDTLAKASTNSSLSDMDGARDRVEKVEEKRESLQTAWILGRHVSRVKVVRPVPRPERSEFTSERFEWERYVGHLALYYTRGFTAGYIDDFESPPFDLEDLARIIERIAITSAPWQSFLVNVRHVYMWKDPKLTARWLVLFCVLWYTEHIMGYCYFYVIYSTLRNKFRPSSVQTVRESVTRAIDREARVQAWGELIQRHGRHDWLEPFLDEIGPVIQMQLGDLANFLEVMVNFYRHERPRLTLATIFFFTCCLLTTLLADMAFCMKLVWFIFGGGFFLTYPIATRYPQYRVLVSHFRWVFWDIPTHAELAILRLQEKGVQFREDEHAFTVVEKETENGRGRLVISRTGLALGERTWPFSTLEEIRKVEDVDSDSTLKNLKNLHSRSAGVLQFWFTDETALTILLHGEDRDRVFNLVLAWSGLKWQSLQMDRHNEMDSDRTNLDRAIKRAFR